jgi:hypothetical protein
MMISVAMKRVWRERWVPPDCASVYPTSRRPEFQALPRSRHEINRIGQAWPGRAYAPGGRHFLPLTPPFLGYKATMPTYVKLILACILCLAVITGLVLLVQHLF